MTPIPFRQSARSRSRDQHGQVLVVFALALVAIVAMTGLVIDGGATFVQRRDEQNVADAAAMAAGYGYANTGSTVTASTAGQTIASANGYTNGTGGATVTVTNTAGNPGWYFTAIVSRPHDNNFSGLLGMPQWGVTAQATVLAGRPNAAIGPLPVIFNQDVFTNGYGDGNEKGYSEPDPGNQDVPTGSQKFNWTEFCNNCNADSNTVRDLIVNHASDHTTVRQDDKISPLNAGSHTTLFDALANLVGNDFAVPIVDNNGIMVGFATFHLTGAVGGSTKQIRGYFVSPFKGGSLTIVQGAGAGGNFGSYAVQLTN